MKKQGRDDKMTYHSGSRWKNSKQVENGLGSRWKSSRWENVNHPGSKMVEWPNPRWERSNLWPGITIFCHESCWETSFIWGCFQDQKNHCLQLLHGHAASLLLLHMKLDTSFHNIFTIQTMIGYGQTGWKPVLQTLLDAVTVSAFSILRRRIGAWKIYGSSFESSVTFECVYTMQSAKNTQAHALRLVGGRMAPKNIANACAFLHEFECGIEFDWILATCAAANQDHCCNGAALSSCSLSGEARLLLAKENLSKDSSCRSPGPLCISVFMLHGSTTIGQWLKHCASFFGHSKDSSKYGFRP